MVYLSGQAGIWKAIQKIKERSESYTSFLKRKLNFP